MPLRHPMNKNAAFLALVLGLLLQFTAGERAEAGGVEKKIPSVQACVRLALAHASSKPAGDRNSADIVFQVKDLYYQIQYKSDQLSIAKEVRGHFKKASVKSQEKFDEGEEDISQSDITKLKLGLSGARNDIIDLEAGIKKARLSLLHLLGWSEVDSIVWPEEGIKPLDFTYNTLEEYLKDGKTSSGTNKKNPATSTPSCLQKLNAENRLELEKAFINIESARKKNKLAIKSRKITRALLVAEVANYDFGLGDSAELFQALIIYTRVLTGYYHSVYNWNKTVAELDRQSACVL